jgi:hypothetical protein
MYLREKRDILMEYTLKNGYFQGTVVDDNDPKQASRVKVQIDFITDEIKVDYLPWYYIEQPLSSSPNSKTDIPKVNSRVIVTFDKEDIMNGIVKCSVVSKPPAKS